MQYIERSIDKELLEWKNQPLRKPLLIRGARQVGKSSSVRNLGRTFEYFIELDFISNKSIHRLFEGDIDPVRIYEELSLIFNTPIIPNKTLVFFDEIQSCIPAITSLRYFYEKTPDIHLIAAGSLLEFALKDLPSFGVGRISSIYLYPFSFSEFLLAFKERTLVQLIEVFNFNKPLSETLHTKLKQYLIRFITIGGMPEVVASYVNGKSLIDCQKILEELTNSFYDDFAKYKSRVPSTRLRGVFSSVIMQTGSKFVISQIESQSNHLQLKESLELLVQAGIIFSVVHSSSNGIPLGAQTNNKFRKYLIFDTGIYQRFLNLDLSELLLNTEISLVNKGVIAELHVGLELIKAQPDNQAPSLHYWQREKKGSQAEVDYVIELGDKIIPIEVKSGIKGKMQSLRIFIEEKGSKFGVRTSLENFSRMKEIRIIPLYAIGKIFKANKHNPLI
ncbi:MAG: AAA family ATPase [Bacteroidales bacterium]